ncbi:TetR/AcrR family transcriptional regulator [Pseudomonas aeruginosa]|uniref:TetR/AcrR family transcriptional regulator n=1 Tax=Pseudomonas aeruginosa TaxID=287 RepID=UPI001C114B61|nr:TetR/AcrR family transcriptional regulator [Pseudomonas aeruginosa]MBU5718428.1 TetR/AcrR family transcriptional regulator [Pseudomonas aeruginosa]MBU5787819.1 TetR/AcrR family transcriptional regulator [Pseudomonas aeruginosa]
MRYKPEQKQATRALLLSKAAPLVKRQGFASTGLDTLMKAAGLTTGAFYSQFSSKAELLEAILQRELSAQHDAFPLDSLEQLAGAPVSTSVAVMRSMPTWAARSRRWPPRWAGQGPRCGKPSNAPWNSGNGGWPN